MKHACVSLAFFVVAVAAGCAGPSGGPRIVGDHAAHYRDVWSTADMAHSAPTADAHHTFTLRNEGDAPATIVAHRTRINTVWNFMDSGSGELPRTIEPGQSVEVVMRGRMYQAGHHRFFTDLTLDTGQVVTLELHADG